MESKQERETDGLNDSLNDLLFIINVWACWNEWQQCTYTIQINKKKKQTKHQEIYEKSLERRERLKDIYMHIDNDASATVLPYYTYIFFFFAQFVWTTDIRSIPHRREEQSGESLVYFLHHG